MKYQTFSFVTGPHRDGTGSPLYCRDRLPVMRPRKLDIRAEVARLDTSIEYFQTVECTFWACKGAQCDIPMTTCSRCHGLRALVATRETLAASCGLPSLKQSKPEFFPPFPDPNDAKRLEIINANL